MQNPETEAGAGEGVEQQEPSCQLAGGGKMLPPLWKTVWWFLIKLDIVSHHDTRFGIYLRDLKIYAHAKTRKCIFIAASFITASTMEEPR